MRVCTVRAGPCRLGLADQEQRDRRDDIRDRVDEHRERRADDLDQPAREARAADLRERRAGRELAVALDDAVDTDQRRDVGGIRGVEEHAQTASTNTTR